jgi:hypothetical protein
VDDCNDQRDHRNYPEDVKRESQPPEEEEQDDEHYEQHGSHLWVCTWMERKSVDQICGATLAIKSNSGTKRGHSRSVIFCTTFTFLLASSEFVVLLHGDIRLRLFDVGFPFIFRFEGAPDSGEGPFRGRLIILRRGHDLAIPSGRPPKTEQPAGAYSGGLFCLALRCSGGSLICHLVTRWL